jgi:hypothetical protein
VTGACRTFFGLVAVRRLDLGRVLAQGVEHQREPDDQRRATDETRSLAKNRWLAAPLRPAPADHSDRDRAQRTKDAHDAQRRAEVRADQLRLSESERRETGDSSDKRNQEPNRALEKHETSHDRA